MGSTKVFGKHPWILTLGKHRPTDGFVKILKKRALRVLLPCEHILTLPGSTCIQFQISFPPITITAVNASSVTCKNHPARSPVTPPNCR